MKRIGFILTLLLVYQFAICQQSDYVKTFDWLVKTFEENDAGFKYYLEQKGADDYAKHTATFRAKIEQVKSEQEYLSLMNNWLYYFRKGHIGFLPKEKNIVSLSEVDKDSIKSRYKNEECVSYTKLEFEQYLLDNAKRLHPIEGVWKDINYTIGIRQSNDLPQKFDAFILKGDSIYCLPYQKKAELTMLNDSTFDVSYLMRNHSIQKTTAKIIGSNHNLLSLYNLWTKILPNVKYSLKDSLYLNLMTSNKPFLRNLSPKTIYLRIPSFDIKQKVIIDKVLAQNDKLIRSTPNLIIDIRNGTGGSDGSSYGLIPYYYTNPIRHPGLKYGF